MTYDYKDLIATLAGDEYLLIEDLEALRKWSKGPLLTAIEEVLDNLYEEQEEQHYMDYGDMYRPDPTTGDLVYKPENDYEPRRW